MTPITDAADGILARPAPVLITDTCNFLDLLRVALPSKDIEKGRWPEVLELDAAKNLLAALSGLQPSLHHVVPELVPGEFADNADRIVEPAFAKWLETHDEHRQWLSEAAGMVGFSLPSYTPVTPSEPSQHFREFAERLLATATVLARDNDCLFRAVSRLVAKRRPSHKKEMKDSMNLEQVLELCNRLSASGSFPHPLLFVSSNTNDFAKGANDTQIHPDLKPEFDKFPLTYFTSLRAARGHLLKQGYSV